MLHFLYAVFFKLRHQATLMVEIQYYADIQVLCGLGPCKLIAGYLVLRSCIEEQRVLLTKLLHGAILRWHHAGNKFEKVLVLALHFF